MFNIEELSILAMYSRGEANRVKAATGIITALPYVNDASIQSCMEATLQKLLAISDAEFNSLDLSATLFTEQEEFHAE